MICKDCGNENANSAKFCRFCGSKLPEEVICADAEQVNDEAFAEEKVTKPICKKCGNENKESAKFCRFCGASMTEEACTDLPNEQNTTYVPQNEKPDTLIKEPGNKKSHKKHMPLYIVAGVVLVLAIVAGFLFTSGAFEDEAEPKRREKKKDVEVYEDIEEIEDSVIREIINDNSSYTDFGIYVKNLSTGYEYGYNEDREFLASAMGQVVILDALSEVVDRENIDINSEEIYFSYIPNGKEAPYSSRQDGSYLTLDSYVSDVAVYGDNNKSNHIVDYIADQTGEINGFDYINSALRARGYENTSINRKTYINPDYVDYSVEPNSTTPSEIANIFADLITCKTLGNEEYMKGIFKSVGGDGKPIGLKKHIPSYYSVCNVNALTDQCTNNVAIVEYDGVQILVAILSTTEEDMTSVETDEERNYVQAELIDYILETQFDD